MPSQPAASISCAVRALPRAEATPVVHSCTFFSLQPAAPSQHSRHPVPVELPARLGYNCPMSAADLTLAQEFKRRAEKALPGRIVRVMLYGSRARGDARPDSDWDVAIFLDGPPTSNDRRVLSDIGFDLMMEYGNHVQTVAIDAARSVEDSSILRNGYDAVIAA